ncbi:MAG TPA: tetratricopeptide repeat protein, partial [Pyrinomonadaceae bacterium]|nr:tetratricopeptide repeat protein [Pyrinomonadaceae bacterium]
GDPAEAVAALDAFIERAARRGRGVPPEVAAARAEILAGLPAEAGAREEKREPRRRAAESLKWSGVNAAGRPLAVGKRTYDFLRRARAAREGARFDEAVALYREAIESNGGYFAPADLELGFALAGLRRTDEAAAQFLAVTRRSGPRYPIAFYHLGRLLEHAGQFPEAGDAYARAAELMGDAGPQFFVDLSRAREKEGKPAEAVAAMESYLRAAERLGDVPGWARERLAKLRKLEKP